MKHHDYIGNIEALSHNPQTCKMLLNRLQETLAGRQMRFMEVCGTHTVAIFQSGLRSLLPENVIHLSGPGCPVCVTHESEIELFLSIAAHKDIIIATFGDLLRVPGKSGISLRHKRAEGGNIEIVYSPLDALGLAESNPHKEVVFIGIGFETTAPAIAASILQAAQKNITNFSVLSCHKLIPPALEILLEENPDRIDGFLLPGHVATITGLDAFVFLPASYGRSGVVGGFEPVDLLIALCNLADSFTSKKPAIINAYPRSVPQEGNPRARQLLDDVFYKDTALWRGLGKIPGSGLSIRSQYENFDAIKKFDLVMQELDPVKGCKCGDVLRGLIQPGECPLFGKKCTPANPVGPCMVSTEGSCAAWYKYGAS